jgi:hypothetical protein
MVVPDPEMAAATSSLTKSASVAMSTAGIAGRVAQGFEPAQAAVRGTDVPLLRYDPARGPAPDPATGRPFEPPRR